MQSEDENLHAQEPLSAPGPKRPSSAAMDVRTHTTPQANIALVRKSRKRRKRYWTSMAAYFVMSAVLALVTICVSYVGAMLLSICLPLGILAFAGYGAPQAQREWRQSIRDFIEADDIRTIGMLIDVVSAARNSERQVTADALIGMLVRLRKQDTDLLNAADRALLHGFLTAPLPEERREGYPLSLAILQAYREIGTMQDLPTVENLAFATHQVADRRVREAAQACLPILKVRLEEARDARILLRAASSDQSSSQTLLRPGHSEETVNPGELLRAAPRLDEEL